MSPRSTQNEADVSYRSPRRSDLIRRIKDRSMLKHNQGHSTTHRKRTQQYDKNSKRVMSGNGNPPLKRLRNYLASDVKMEMLKAILKTLKKKKCFKIAHVYLEESHFLHLANELRDFDTNYTFKVFIMRDCNVSARGLQELVDSIGSRKIVLLDLSGNGKLSPKLLSKLIKNTKPRRVVLNECSLHFEETTMTKVLFGPNTSVVSLELSHFGYERSCIPRVMESAFASPITELSLVDCGLTSDDFRSLQKQGIKVGQHIQVLDLSCNFFDSEAMKCLAIILPKASEMRRLSLCDCQLDSQGLENFWSNAKTKIKEIDLSDNALGDERCLDELPRVISTLQPDKMVLNNCQIRDVKRLWNSAIKKSITLRHLELGENLFMEAKDVGILASNWQLQELHIFNCGFTVEDLKILRAEFKNPKLTYLDVSDLSEIPSKTKKTEVDALRQIVKNVKFDTFDTCKGSLELQL